MRAGRVKTSRMKTDRSKTGRIQTTEDQLFFLGLVFAGVGTVLALIWFFLVPAQWKPQGCVWDRMFGIYCPGCGGTRAVRALLHGRIFKSLWYHPLVPYTVAVFGSFMVSQAFARLTGYRYTRGIKFHGWYLYGALIITAVNWIGKNVLRAVWNITL